jgi:hypothetical protein
MKYERPSMEIIMLPTVDVVTLSSESSGSGDNVSGGWDS